MRRAAVIETTVLAFLAAVVGVVSAYAALGFLVLIHGLQEGLLGIVYREISDSLFELPTWRIIGVPVAVGLVIGLTVRYVLPGQRHYGPADVVEAARRGDGRMPLGAGLVSAAASILSIGAGASVGRYGPAVHLGGTLGAWLATVFRLPRPGRVALLAGGVAAAIAAAFNAPLAGVLFAHEVVIGGFAARAVMPVVIGSAAGALIARLHGSAVPIFALPDVGIQYAHEYPLVLIVGLLGAGLALVYMRSMSVAAAQVARLPVPLWLQPAIGGLLLGVVVVFFPPVYGLGERAIQHGLAGGYGMWLLLALIPIKLIATSLSLGFGFSGGVLGPALFLGTMLGMLCGVAVAGILPDASSPAAVYGVAGMGAVVSRVVGAPIATILIVFELTHSYSMTTGAMIAVVVASVVRSRHFPGSFFDLQLSQRGIDAHEGREVVELRGRTVGEVMRPVPITVSPRVTISEALEQLLRHRDEDLYLLDKGGALRGRASLFALVSAERAGRGSREVAEIAEHAEVVLSAASDLHEALLAIRDFVGISLPVVADRESARLVGLIHESELIVAYDDAVRAAREEQRSA